MCEMTNPTYYCNVATLSVVTKRLHISRFVLREPGSRPEFVKNRSTIDSALLVIYENSGNEVDRAYGAV